MEKLIDIWFKAAGEARDWDCYLRYKWILAANEGNEEIDIMDNFFKEKAKGF